MKTEVGQDWLKTGINRSILINCRVVKCSSPAPYGHLSFCDGVHLGPEKDTCRHDSLSPIDTSFDPPLFSIDSTVPLTHE